MPFRLALVLLLALSPSALAQKKKVDPVEQQARGLFAEAQKAYDVGEFERALTLYSDAYKLKALPGFLFNIAQCHRQLGNYERAAFFYGRFIDNSNTTAPNVELARELLSDVSRRQSEKEAAEKKAADEKAEAERRAADAPVAPPLTPTELSTLPPPPPPVVEPEPVTKKAWFWVVIGVGVAAVATGVTVGAVAASQPREVMYVPRMTSLPDIDGRR
ncbi:MAG: hypothetical protein SFW67_18805 [Myxococcaceae bacterium]|nr:hypothetical protein [Myxococcaceae bacterium]